ncbi:MAG: hypothetical protein LAN59_00545 [Acidobacteriia bacterium]|nr:hypothetical protein [Terriglobia bacterium]
MDLFDSSAPHHRLIAILTLIGVALVGLIAYLSAPQTASFGPETWTCVGWIVFGMIAGGFAAWKLQGRLPAEMIEGISGWLMGMFACPGVRFIRDSTNWVFHPRAGQYTFSGHLLAVSLGAILLVTARKWSN